MKPTVVIPFKSKEPERLRNLSFVCAWWWNLGFKTIISETDPYTKGSAVADGVSKCKDDFFIIADADAIVEPYSSILDAVHLVRESPNWVVPYETIWRLTEEATRDYVRNRYNHTYTWYDEIYQPVNVETTVPPYRAVKGGGITAIHRNFWNEVGGIDPRFEGWGGEDQAFGRALETLCAPAIELPGRLIHLWHQDQGPRRAVSKATQKLSSKYQVAWQNPQKMRLVIQERNEN